jgi:tape measure domain-containing protein
MAVVSDIEIRLRADIARLQTDMNAARRSVDGAMGGITQAAAGARNALMSIAGGLGAGALASMVDQYVKFTSQLKLATQSQREYNAAYADVKRIAAGSTQSLQETGVLYARIANGTRELGVSQKQVAAITETVNLALLVSGATANEAASAQLQLSQAFASGTLRGEEFNAVNEAAPRLMKALADGIGVPVGALKKMAEEGLITSEIMANVLPNALVTLREEAKNIQTISGSFTLLKNNAIEFVGSTAQASGAVTAISTLLSALANNLNLVAGALLTVVAVKIANFFDAAIARTVAAVAANNALIASNLATAKAEFDAANAADRLAGARLNEVRAAQLAATGNVQLALTMNGVIPAQNRAAATSVALSASYFGLAGAQAAATLGARALNAALAFTGGPLGLIITLLGVAATAWGYYEYSQTKANEKAAADTKESASEMTENLAKVNEMLRERARLQRAGAGEAVTGDDPRSQELRDTLREINDLKARGAALDASDQIRLISLQGIYNGLNKEMTDNINLRREQEANGQAAQALVSVRERLTGINGQYLKELGLLQTALSKGAIGQAEYTDLVSRLAKETYTASDAGKAAAEAAKKSEQAAKDAGRAAKEQAQEYADLISTLTGRAAATAREAEGLAELTKAEEASLDLTEKLRLGKIKLTAAQEGVARSLIQEAGANDVLAASRKADEKLQQQLANNMRDLAAERYTLIESAKQEAEQNELAVKTFGMAEAAIIRLNAARLIEQETQRLGRSLTEDEIADLNRVIALKERSAQAVAARAELEAAKTFWTDIEKTAHDTFVSIADGGKGAFQRLKDTAKNTFFDWLYQQTLKKWIINIGTSTSGVDLSSLAGGPSGSPQGGITMDKIFSAFKSGGSLEKSIAESVQKGFDTAGLSPGGGAPGQAAQWAGKLGSTIGGYLAGSALNKGISGGYETGSGFMKAEKLATAVGSYINPVLGAAIGAISGVINRAFGMKAKEYGPTTLNGSLGNGAFKGTLDTAWTQKGGFFRSDKAGTDKAAVDAVSASGLIGAYEVIKAASTSFAQVLGINADAIATRTQSISIAMGKDEAANQKAIADFFTGVANTVAGELLPEIAKFQVSGEEAAATLQRLATNYAGLDQILVGMSSTSQKAFGAVGTASLEARERLIAFAGGLDALAAQTTYFNENFLTQAERITIVQKPLNDALSALGYAGITTADQFKTAVQEIVSSGRLATQEGAATYAGLLAIAPQFKTVADYLKELGDAAAETALNLASRKRDLEITLMEVSGDTIGALAARRAIETAAADASLRPLLALIYARQDEATAAQAAAEAADLATAALERNEEALRKGVDDAFSAIGRAVNAQKEQVTKAYESVMTRLAASITTVTARVGDLTKLSDLLSSSLVAVESDSQSVASRAAARSQVQAAIAIAKASGVLPTVEQLQGALSTLKIDNSDQFSTMLDYQREVARTNQEIQALGGLADKQLTDAQRQLAVLEDQKTLAERQYADEIARLDGVLEWAQAEVDAINGVRTDVQSVVAAIAGLKVAGAALQAGATPSNPTGGALSVEDLYRTVLGREGEAAGVAYWKGVFGAVVDSNEYAEFIRGAQPELNQAPPIAYTAPASGTMPAGTVSALQEEMSKRMDAKMSRMVEGIEKFASQFENVSGGGQSLFVENVNAAG